MTDLKEYTVTVVEGVDFDDLHNDLIAAGSTSEAVPEREVSVADYREINERSASYFLTDEEALLLKQDPRVLDTINLNLLQPIRYAFQDTDFNKTSVSSGQKSNWGLLRHISQTNVFGTSTSDPGGTYDYVLDGTGVDVVIVDSGIQADHPEFQDANGVSRVQQINWYNESGVTGILPASFYTDYDGHGTHVAATVAGKTFGWARNARIYSIKLSGLQGVFDPNGGISAGQAFDCILGWHFRKNNSRPTIVNNSWGYSIYWHTDQGALSYSSDGTSGYYPITGGSYRSVNYLGSTKDQTKGHTGTYVGVNVWGFPLRVSSVDADISQMANAGIIVCNAAGNDNMKIDLDTGGIDSNNYVTTSSVGALYYHKGSSPNGGGSNSLEVGSLGTGTTGGVETRSSFSNAGPGVEIYAAGSNIISAVSNSNMFGNSAAYFGNASFAQTNISGTSMASPQIAGIAALIKQVYPDWTTSQIRRWIISNAKALLYTTGSNDDYTSTVSLFGGDSRLCYFPMGGQKKYNMSGAPAIS